MKQIKLLLRPYFLSLWGLNRLKYSHQPRAGLKRAAIFVFIPLAGLFFLLWATAYCVVMASALTAMGQLEAVPVGMLSVGAFLTLITSIAHGGQQMLAFRDYDIQMSLPVSPGLLALSRLIISYAEGLGISLLTLVPAFGVYSWFVRPGFLGYATMGVVVLLSPALPVIVGTTISALIARFSARFRSAQYLRIALSLGVMGVYFVSCFSLGSKTDEQVARMAVDLSSSLSRFYPPALLLSRALQGSVASLLTFIVLSVGAFGLAGLFYTRKLRRLHSIVTENHARGHFRAQRLNASSPLKALYKRELARYFSSTVYVLNTLFGSIMGLICAIAVLLQPRDQLANLLSAFGDQTMILSLLPVFIAFFICTGISTASSISLEGSSHWILQCLPVPVVHIFRAKILFNLTLLAPLFTVVPALLALALRPDALTALFLFLIPLLASVSLAEFGLVINLRLHRFDWKSEKQVIKQGAPVTIVQLLSMLVIFLFVALIFVFPDIAHLLCALLAAIFAILGLICGVILRKRAQKGLRFL